MNVMGFVKVLLYLVVAYLIVQSVFGIIYSPKFGSLSGQVIITSGISIGLSLIFGLAVYKYL
jgi:hypothetical protein